VPALSVVLDVSHQCVRGGLRGYDLAAERGPVASGRTRADSPASGAPIEWLLSIMADEFQISPEVVDVFRKIKAVADAAVEWLEALQPVPAVVH
jgi:hypothetical protein